MFTELAPLLADRTLLLTRSPKDIDVLADRDSGRDDSIDCGTTCLEAKHLETGVIILRVFGSSGY